MARPKTKPEIELPPSTQRLGLVVKESGLSNTEFADRIGMSSGGFGNLFLRGTKVSEVLARAVELEFQISYQWLLTGEGDQRAASKLTSLQKLKLRLFPEFSPNVLWDMFEALLKDNAAVGLQFGKSHSPNDFARLAIGVFARGNSTRWQDELNDRKRNYESLLQETKKEFLSFADVVKVGTYSQEILLQILLEGLELTDDILVQLKSTTGLQDPSGREEYIGRFKRFSEMRYELKDHFAPPRELMEEFVHLENAYMDRCEKQEIAKIRNGQEFKPLVGWFWINEEQVVDTDLKRSKISDLKMFIAGYEFKKRSPEFSNSKHQEALTQIIESLTTQLEELIDSWEKGGGDGTTG